MIRDCYTCARAPTWRGVGTMADCLALTGDEATDAPVVAFCEASGCNDDHSDRPGWPRKGNALDCPKWRDR